MEGHLRPGGLTALAVINFVFAGLGAIGLLGLATMAAGAGVELPKELQDVPRWLLWLSAGFILVYTCLLLASGLAYLKLQRRGRRLGTAYGVLALAETVVEVGAIGQMNMLTILGVVYPVLTLILVNTTFKDDLVR